MVSRGHFFTGVTTGVYGCDVASSKPLCAARCSLAFCRSSSIAWISCREKRKVLGRPRRRKSAHAFLWEYSCKRMKLAQLLDQLGVFLTCRMDEAACIRGAFASSRVRAAADNVVARGAAGAGDASTVSAPAEVGEAGPA
jgi:hypothetical protein